MNIYDQIKTMSDEMAGDLTAQRRDFHKYAEPGWFEMRTSSIIARKLTELGYECVRPQGAFYLFVKSPEPDANAFSERAKKHDVLVVPSDSFGCPGYVRISYCVAEKTIVDSMPAFKAIMEEVKAEQK